MAEYRIHLRTIITDGQLYQEKPNVMTSRISILFWRVVYLWSYVIMGLVVVLIHI